MDIRATLLSEEIAQRLRSITLANGFPFELKAVELGRFYEDLGDDVALPVATLVAAGSAPVIDQQMPQSGQRERQLQVEIVLDLDAPEYSGQRRDVVLDRAEWSLCKVIGGVYSNRVLAGLAIRCAVGQVEFNWPAPGHSIAIVRAQLAATFVELYG